MQNLSNLCLNQLNNLPVSRSNHMVYIKGSLVIILTILNTYNHKAFAVTLTEEKAIDLSIRVCENGISDNLQVITNCRVNRTKNKHIHCTITYFPELTEKKCYNNYKK